MLVGLMALGCSNDPPPQRREETEKSFLEQDVQYAMERGATWRDEICACAGKRDTREAWECSLQVRGFTYPGTLSGMKSVEYEAKVPLVDRSRLEAILRLGYQCEQDVRDRQTREKVERAMQGR